MERKLLLAKHRNTYTRNALIKCLPDLDWKMLEDTDDIVSLYSSLALQTKRILHLGYILNLLFDGIFEECQERLSYLYWTQREYILFFFFLRYQNIKNSKKKVSGKNSFYHCFWYILFKIKLRTIVKYHSYFFLSSLTMRLLSLLERFFFFFFQPVITFLSHLGFWEAGLFFSPIEILDQPVTSCCSPLLPCERRNLYRKWPRPLP